MSRDVELEGGGGEVVLTWAVTAEGKWSAGVVCWQGGCPWSHGWVRRRLLVGEGLSVEGGAVAIEVRPWAREGVQWSCRGCPVRSGGSQWLWDWR